jgi:NOL1/NOP2/fmu family ribosome biogenesis protein
MPLKILNKQEKEIVVKKLNEQFGVLKVPDNLLMFGEEKIFLFTGDLKILEKLQKLENRKINLAGIGCYIAKEQQGNIRLSIEGTHLFKNQITKNIFELNKEQKEKWMHGNQLDIETGKKGFLIMKYEKDFLGTGKASEDKIGNFIPKSRRLKEKS